MKNLFVFLFLCNFLLLCHAHGGGNYEHSDMLASMKPGDKAALLMVDRIIGMQSDVATETITSLLLKIGHCDDQFAAVEQITVHLTGGTLVIADMSVIDDERAHFRPQIDVSILADGGHPSEIAADEILHFLCKLRHEIGRAHV